ncbi:Protein penguin [Strongyloides ratti]|uniref:Protein penguin n=1 Tax=Strongyloides ratti TaxID=34506 RepID=A0A090LA60_STRRB|nr:Protein penguin [Strongyloides ratti]CEF66622.1 Protein penguin [Strongyloides ratti]
MAKAVKKAVAKNSSPQTSTNGKKKDIKTTPTNGDVTSDIKKTPAKKRKITEDIETPLSVKKLRFLEDRNEVKFFKKGSLLPPLKPSPCTPGRSILKSSATSTPIATVGKKKKSFKPGKKVVIPIKKDETSSEESESDNEELLSQTVEPKKNGKKVVEEKDTKDKKSNGDNNLVANGKGKENKIIKSPSDDSQSIKNELKGKKNKESKVATSKEDKTVEVQEQKSVNSNDDDTEVNIEPIDISGKDGSSEYQIFTKEDKEKMKGMTPEEKTKFINARLYETCKSKKKSEVKEFLRNLRVKKKPHIKVAYEIKKLWEELRMKKTNANRKKEIGLEMIVKMKGEMLKLVNGRDTSKVFQCLLCLDDPQITKSILDELNPHLLTMSRSKYGSFFVTMLFTKTHAAERQALFDAFRGHIVKLYDIVFSAKVVDILYNQVATEKQKLDILCEFFGKEFVIFRQQDDFKNVKEMFDKYPDKKPIILKNLLSTIKNCVGKKTISFDFTHVLINTYLDNCSKDQGKEVIDLLREKILDLTLKKGGTKIALRILFNSSAKERKNIIKSMTSLVSSIAMDHNGYQLILGLFDQMDDTVLVNKTITSELINHLPDIVKSHNGNVVLQYMVQPRDPKIIDSHVIDLLSSGDNNEHSKKDRTLRAQQIYDEIKDPLFQYVTNFGRDILKNKFTAHLLYTIFENNKDTYLVDRQVPDTVRETIYKKIADVIEEYFKKDEDESKNYKFLERNRQANFTINELLKTDKKCTIKLSSFLVNIDKNCFPVLLKTNVGKNLISNMYKYGNKSVKDFVKKVAPSAIH